VAEEKAVTVSFPLPPALVVVGDRRRLRQVFANLLDNAVKYTPEGCRVSIAASARDGRAVVVVEDTGPGIPPEDMPHIWERLYRGDKSRSQPGLGLGLSLVRAMVQAHGGTVEAASAPGAGARFTVMLPTSSATGPTDSTLQRCNVRSDEFRCLSGPRVRQCRQPAIRSRTSHARIAG
jgi:signal transduction histidine kinase